VKNRLITLALWLLPAGVLSIALARGAVWMQREGYVSALSPIVLGAVLGMMTLWLARKAGESGRTCLLAGTFLVALTCVVAEHLYFYLDYCVKIVETAQREPKLQMFPDTADLLLPSFSKFLHDQAAVRLTPGGMPNWLWWIIDAKLTIVTSMAVVAWISRPTSQNSSGVRSPPRHS
jgi:hypothetical protein